MKISTIKKITIWTLLFLTLLIPTTAFANNDGIMLINEEDNPNERIMLINEEESEVVVDEDPLVFVLNDGQVRDEDIFLKGYNDFTNDGQINGLCIFYSLNTKAGGDFLDNVITFSNTFNLSGNINKNLIAFGSDFYLNDATIKESVIIYGSSIITGENTVIGKDIIFYGDKAQIKGDIKGDITISASSVVINGNIAGDVTIASSQVTIGSDAVISGNLTYQSESPIVLSEEAIIKGETVSKDLGYLIPSENSSIFSLIFSLFRISGLFLLIMLTFAFVTFLPISAMRLEIVSRHNVLKQLSYGSMTILLFLPIIFILAITVVGLPIAVFALILYYILFFISSIPAGMLVGSLLFRNNTNLLFRTLAGILLLKAFSYMPLGFINNLIVTFFNIAGLGCIVLLFVNSIKNKIKAEKAGKKILLKVSENPKDIENAIKELNKDLNKNITENKIEITIHKEEDDDDDDDVEKREEDEK